jgi:predicted short-subunit dehydrogenase-like oxidoreductase (DUF2520 family)
MATITLIGSGNIAWQLGLGLIKAGHTIEVVYSRTISNAKILSELIPNSIATDSLNFKEKKSELFIVAIKDQALEEVLQFVVLPPNAIIAHTSGSVSIEVVQRFPKHGVFYPLQTFTKGKETDLSKVPFGIEASDEVTYKTLITLAQSISESVQPISSHQRKVLHIAAVFACNFTNYLFSVSDDILKKEKLNFELLKPLVEETIQKAFEIGPVKGQTGPAVRGDKEIIQQHLEYLKQEPALQKLYQLISERISKRGKEGAK